MTNRFPADFPIYPQISVNATQKPPRLRAVSTFARPVSTALRDLPPPPLTIRPLTHATLGWKALWGEGSPLNSPHKNRAPLPRNSRFAHANRNASGTPFHVGEPSRSRRLSPVYVGEPSRSRRLSPAPGKSRLRELPPRGFSRCTVRCEFSIHKHCSGKTSSSHLHKKAGEPGLGGLRPSCPLSVVLGRDTGSIIEGWRGCAAAMLS